MSRVIHNKVLMEINKDTSDFEVGEAVHEVREIVREVNIYLWPQVHASKLTVLVIIRNYRISAKSS
jgi:hypothetical protein